MAMSRKALAIWYALIVALGVFGVWLGAAAHDSSDIRRWLGLVALLAAVLALVVVYHRDLRASEREKEIEWRRAKAYGKTRFLLTRLLFSQVVWLPDAFAAASHLFQTRSFRGLPAPSPASFVFAFACAAFSVAWSLFWWHRQERLRSSGAG